MSFTKKQIRQQIRQRRRELDINSRNQAAISFLDHFRKNLLYKKCKSVAIYLPNDGELDLTPLLHHAQTLRKKIYLPVVHGPAFNRMWFAPINKHSKLKNNRYGIPEPVVPMRKMLKPKQIDLVLLPLVAFDMQGNRLGMGGGYYDRSFAFLRSRKKWHRPLLVGVAYDFQQIDELSADPWDVPLNAIATDTRFIKFATG